MFGLWIDPMTLPPPRRRPLSLCSDGIFWMSFEDVLKHFFSLNVCMTDMTWTEARRKSIFTYGADLVDLDGDGDTSESVVTSTIFKLTVKEPTTLHLGVHQEDERCLTAKPYLDVGLTSPPWCAFASV